jgi:hypothetical protein
MRHLFLSFVVCVGVCMPAALDAQAEPLTPTRVTPDELIWKALPIVPGLQRADLVGDDKKSGVYVIRTLWVPKTLNPTIVVMKSAKDGA